MFPGILWVPLALYSSLPNSHILEYPLKKWQLRKAESPETKMDFRCRSNKFIGPMMLLPISHRDQRAQGSLHEPPTLTSIPHPVSKPFSFKGGQPCTVVPSQSPCLQRSTEIWSLKGPLRLMAETLISLTFHACPFSDEFSGF